MNKFLKLAVIPVAFLIAGSTTSCAVSPKEIALITDVGDIDDGSFNQESWEAVKEYAINNHKSYDFYRPFNDSEFARSCAVKQAVAKGAQVIVLPGFKFASTCANCMGKYPNVHFLLIDSYVHNGDYNAIDPLDNVCCVGFECEYSGFIAGYTIAQDLMTRDLNETSKILDKYGYGYVGGMASDGVYQFGFGFIQGVCQATAAFCKERSLELPQLHFDYSYAGVFAQDDATAIKVKSWYANENNGVKVVFPCGGKLYQSVTEAAQYYNKHNLEDYDAWLKGGIKAPRNAARWVGVDSDQYRGLKYDYELQSIYTSALKGLNPTIINALQFHYDGDWDKIGGVHDDVTYGGQQVYGSKWMLGLHSILGEFDSEEELEDEYDDYVGIPILDAYDEETGIMRGFDNFKYDDGTSEHKSDYIGLYNKLISDDPDRLRVYGGNGVEWSHNKDMGGYPDGMESDSWWNSKNSNDDDKIYFREKYLGDYPKEKIDPIKTL